MKKYFTVLLIIFVSLKLTAMLEVSLDGTKPYTEIQTALNQAVYGDTILVYPGHYFENLELTGLSGLTLSSLEILTGNEEYISTTVIDGSNNIGATIRCNENTTTCTIQGLSITGGTGNVFDGQPHNVLGGGMYIKMNCSIELKNLNVYNNRASSGGGIAIFYSSTVTLENVNIYDNIARWRGGGLLIVGRIDETYEVTFSQNNRCSIYNNFANWGMDIYWSSTHDFDGEIYLNKFTKSGYDRYFADWYERDEDNIPESSPYAVFNVEEAYLEEVDCDLYVSPEGNDNNSGLSPNSALKTPSLAMQRIMSNPSNPNTVHLLAGEHHNYIQGEYLPISVKEYTILKGLSPSQTKIYAENMFYGYAAIGFMNTSHSPTVCDLSITTNMANSFFAWRVYDCLIKNVVIEDSVIEFSNFYISGPDATMRIEDVTLRNIHALYSEYGLRLWGEDIVIDNLTIQDCYNDPNDDWIYRSNGALDITNDTGTAIIKNSTFVNNVCESEPGFSLARVVQFNAGAQTTIIMDNCLFANNSSLGGTKMLNLLGSEIYFSNCTVANNYHEFDNSVMFDGNASVRNSIFANNQSRDMGYSHDLYLENNLFTKNENDNIFCVWDSSDMLVDEGNIFGQDPLFAGTDPATKEHYRLFADDENGFSPAIDGGIMDSQYANEGYQLPELDLYGNTRMFGENIDIGCFESPGYTGNDNVELPSSELNAFNYPNPFNPETTIQFNIPKPGKVTVDIYNVRGQLVKNLLNDNLNQGVHEIVWNGTNNANKNSSSGVYFYKIRSGNITDMKKILLIK